MQNAYRQIADKLQEVERLVQECRQIAADAGITFVLPASLTHNGSYDSYVESAEDWASSQACW